MIVDIILGTAIGFLAGGPVGAAWGAIAGIVIGFICMVYVSATRNKWGG